MLQKDNQNTLEFFFVFILFLFSNILTFAFQFWLYPQYVLVESIVWLVLAVIAVWILWKRNLLPILFINLKRNWIIFPFLIFSGLSIFWSVFVEISIYRWLIFIATIITGAYIGLCYELERILRYLTIFVLWILIVSTIVILFMPSIGLQNYLDLIINAWKGIYWHKNHMGFIAALGNILALINTISAFRTSDKYKYLWGFLYLLSLFFVVQTDSVGAYFSLIFTHGAIVLALSWMKFRKKFRRSHLFVFVVVMIIASIIVFTNSDLVFGMFNRSTTLTGRIPMWSHLFDNYINKRPLFGYGFNAFWYVFTHRGDIQQAIVWHDHVLIADNGFIDILVNTGYIGFTMFLIFYVGLWWQAIKFSFNTQNIIEFYPAVLMVYTLIANVSFSLIFEIENFFMLIMISVLFCISKKEDLNAISQATLQEIKS